jgi:hypothetical protein
LGEKGNSVVLNLPIFLLKDKRSSSTRAAASCAKGQFSLKEKFYVA